ncbi:MAG: metallophosphoesterase family protein [Bacteroidota bacterium]
MKYAIISDIHEDIVSLQKVITHINRTDSDKLVCLGDITGFSALHHAHKDTKDANACIDLLNACCDIIVVGNHDLNIIGKIPSYLNRHEKANSNIPWDTWSYKGEANAIISSENLDFLKQLPEYLIETADNFQILFSHFIYPDVTGSTIMIPENKRALKPHFNFMQRKGCLLSFVGHTHINGFALSRGRHVHFKEFGFERLSKKQQIIFGPGIVRNGIRSGYMIFDTDTFELSIIKI